jgi:hypothetical protein
METIAGLLEPVVERSRMGGRKIKIKKQIIGV